MAAGEPPGVACFAIARLPRDRPGQSPPSSLTILSRIAPTPRPMSPKCSMLRKVPSRHHANMDPYALATARSGLHPYYDGNGRSARLLGDVSLAPGRLRPARLFSLEEYHSRDIMAYCRALEVGGTTTTTWDAPRRTCLYTSSIVTRRPTIAAARCRLDSLMSSFASRRRST